MNLYNYDKTSKESILKYAQQFLEKSLEEILDMKQCGVLEEKIKKYKNKRKGHFGDITEEYLFGIKNNNNKQPDFTEAQIELKTAPLKTHKKNKFAPKERLVFSMIDYMSIIYEKWEDSSFLKKNRFLLLMFYLFEKDKRLLQYKYKFIEFLDLLSEVSESDIAQIKKDWEVIVEKIKKGEAHLLSEGNTSYLGAATKSSSGSDRRKQPNSEILAKPRAFSLKTTYLNFLIQKFLGKKDKQLASLYSKNLPLTIDENIYTRFRPFFNKTNIFLEKKFGIKYENNRPKHHRRLLVNKLLGYNSNKIEEFEKANITVKAIAIEPTGILKESISFEIFRYQEIINEAWEDSVFYNQLSSKRFLFVIFLKTKEGYDILKEIKFWNFPVIDLDKAKWVWEETLNRIKNNEANKLPSISENEVAHVRPHGRKGNDTIDTGYGTQEVKKCFWLNAKYIEKQLDTKSMV